MNQIADTNSVIYPIIVFSAEFNLNEYRLLPYFSQEKWLKRGKKLKISLIGH